MRITRIKTLACIAAMATLGAACARKKVAAVSAPAAPPASSSAAPAAAPAARPAPAPAAAASQPAQSRYPDAATQKRIDELLARIQDAYFDYDRHALRPDALATLRADATELGEIVRRFPDYRLTVEGYCDERGSEAYNLGLGDKRAATAREYLAGLGVPESQLNVISYGKERPVCNEHSEACWQKNRRVHIAAMTR